MNDTSRNYPQTALPVAELPVPSGWFAVALSRELPRGHVAPARIGDQDLVVWRDESGTACVATAWCPHLGAHLGYLGRVRGQALVCGFHGFAFGADGSCLATGYEGRVPPRARLTMWPVIEIDGIVLSYHDPIGLPPSWTIPAADAAGWSASRWRTLTFTGHPMEVTENSVDVGHLSFVHGYSAVREIIRASTDGPLLTARYAMTRSGRMYGVPVPAMRTTFDVAAYGLGFSRVDVTVHTLGTQARLWVLPTPLGDGTVRLRLGTAGRRTAGPAAGGPLRWVPGGLGARAVRDFALLGLANDVAQDRRVWATKRHLRRPALAAGDGPIGLYRRWAGQFMPAPPGDLSLPVAATGQADAGAGAVPKRPSSTSVTSPLR
jgi:cholesterol 7-desaturase